MITSDLEARLRDTVTFLKSAGVVMVFSPWAIIIYLLVSNRIVELDVSDQQVILNYIDWFGIVYSAFLAWSLVSVSSKFETIEEDFDKELYSVSSLLHSVKHMRVSKKKKEADLTFFRDEVRKEIEEYLNHVVKNYKLEHIVAEQRQNGDQILENIGDDISLLISKKVISEAFISELFNDLKEIIQARAKRILHSEPSLPVLARLMSVVISMLWLFCFLGITIHDQLVAISLVGGVAFVIIMVLIILIDLSEPFEGIFSISLGAWHDFLDNINHYGDPQVIFIYKLTNTVYSRLQAFIRRKECQLYNFAHTKVYGESWKRFIEVVQRQQQDGHPAIRCRTLYHNELKYNGIPVKDCQWPAVVLKRGRDQKVIMNYQEIADCKDLAAFEELFHKRMQAELPWYVS